MSFYVEDPRAGCNTSHQSGVQGQNLLPHSAYHDAFAAAQDVFGFLGCKCPVLAQVQHLIHKQPEVLLCWASLNPFISHPVSEPGCPLVMCRTLLILIVFTQTCFYSLSRPLWMTTCPSGLSATPLSLVLSADFLRVRSIPISVSLTKILKSTGPTCTM